MNRKVIKKRICNVMNQAYMYPRIYVLNTHLSPTHTCIRHKYTYVWHTLVSDTHLYPTHTCIPAHLHPTHTCIRHTHVSDTILYPTHTCIQHTHVPHTCFQKSLKKFKNLTRHTFFPCFLNVSQMFLSNLWDHTGGFNHNWPMTSKLKKKAGDLQHYW